MPSNQENAIGLWLNYFRPNTYVKSVGEINFTLLARQGVKCVFCDLDNTLAPHFTRLPTKEAFAVLREATRLKMLFIVVSNNRKARVSKFCELLKPNGYLANCKKPLVHKIKRKMAELGLTSDQCMIVGDQFLTDILAANRLKCRSVLVLPLFASSDKKAKGLSRLLEKFIYDRLSQKNVAWTKDTNGINPDQAYEIL